MSVKINSIFVFFIVNMSLYCQPNKNVLIVDSLTKEPINFPLIYFENDEFKYGDYNGKLIIQDGSQGNIIVKSIGYHDKFLSISNIPDSILLSPQNYLLDPVLISPKLKSKPNLVGSFRKGLKNFTFTAFIGSKIVYYIPNINSKKKIKNAILPINKGKKNSFIRILLYEPDSKGLPGLNVIPENLIFESNKVPKFIDLEQYNITIPDKGIFLGIEWLSQEFPNKFIPANSPSILATWILEKCNTYQLLPKINQEWHLLEHRNEKTKCLNIAVGLNLVED